VNDIEADDLLSHIHRRII